MPELSVVIITLNEERNIERCITSVQSFADEIVIVDSLSTDRTCLIAKRMGARIIEQAFLGHIEQKNFAITQASFPIILSLDADEEVSPELAANILNIKETWPADGFTMNRLTNYCGQWIRHSGWYPDSKLRLFDSRKGKWAGMNPHDKYTMTNDSRILHLEGDLFHYSYYTIAEHIKQSEKFSLIAAQAMFKAGRKPRLRKILLNPCFKFFRNYILKGGFRDGFYGFVICRITAFETFMKYLHLRELHQKK
jgi:glycosyltransferase involved in cell wall biosynthesis